MLWHVGAFTALPGAWILMNGFFTLSAFLITRRLLLAEQREYGWISVRDFYRRRVRRLAPPLLVIAALAFARRRFGRSIGFVVLALAATAWVTTIDLTTSSGQAHAYDGTDVRVQALALGVAAGVWTGHVGRGGALLRARDRRDPLDAGVRCASGRWCRRRGSRGRPRRDVRHARRGEHRRARDVRTPVPAVRRTHPDARRRPAGYTPPARPLAVTLYGDPVPYFLAQRMPKDDFANLVVTNAGTPGCDLITRALTSTLTTARASGAAKFAVATVPCRTVDELQVTAEYRVDFDRFPDPVAEAGHPKRVNAIITAWAKEHHVPVIDLAGAVCDTSYSPTRHGVTLYDAGLHFSPQATPMIWGWLAPQIVKASR